MDVITKSIVQSYPLNSNAFINSILFLTRLTN